MLDLWMETECGPFPPKKTFSNKMKNIPCFLTLCLTRLHALNLLIATVQVIQQRCKVLVVTANMCEIHVWSHNANMCKYVHNKGKLKKKKNEINCRAILFMERRTGISSCSWLHMKPRSKELTCIRGQGLGIKLLSHLQLKSFLSQPGSDAGL